jgi:hypothetical protein
MRLSMRDDGFETGLKRQQAEFSIMTNTACVYRCAATGHHAAAVATAAAG